MNITRKILLLIILCLVFGSCVSNISDSNTNENKNKILIEESNNYSIFEIKNDSETYYEYTVYDYRNKVIAKEETYSYPPSFDKISESIIKTTIYHGVGSYSCIYYDLYQLRISEQFQGVLTEKDNLIAYKVFDNGFKIIIQDMFDKSVCYLERVLPNVETATFDIVNAYFEENKLIILPDSKYGMDSIVFSISQ